VFARSKKSKKKSCRPGILNAETPSRIIRQKAEYIHGDMKSTDELPLQIRHFILEKIDSVPHLEALLQMREQPTLTWTAQSVARLVYVEDSVASKILHDFMRRGWVRKLSEVDEAFSYDNAWDPTGEFMDLLAATYRNQLIRVATLIHSNVSPGVRGFADAFNIKKD
jgi:hypothetical protein